VIGAWPLSGAQVSADLGGSVSRPMHVSADADQGDLLLPGLNAVAEPPWCFSQSDLDGARIATRANVG
jgi:hypothetical protein